LPRVSCPGLQSGALFLLALASCSRSSAAVSSPPEASPPPLASASSEPEAAPPPTATPPPPEDDVIADLETRRVAAGAELGRRTLTADAPGAFLFVDADHGSRFEAARALGDRFLSAMKVGPFARGKVRATTVFVFSSTGAYLSACARHHVTTCSGSRGAWNASTREVFVDVDKDPGSVAAWTVPSLVDSDFPAAPPWLVAGLTALFDPPVFGADGDPHAAADDAGVRGAGTAPDVARARSFLAWLDARGDLWPFYARWRGSVAKDPAGLAALSAVVGDGTGPDVDGWRSWLAAVDASAR
jgi:hypothetical protein